MPGIGLASIYLCILTLPLQYLRYYPFKDNIRIKKKYFLMGLFSILIFECYAASRIISYGHFFFIHYIDGVRLFCYFLFFCYSCIVIKEDFFTHIISSFLVFIFTGLLTLPCSIIEFFYSDVKNILFYRSIALIAEMTIFLYWGIKYLKKTIIPIINKSTPTSIRYFSAMLFLILLSIYIPTWNITWLKETPFSYIAIRVVGILNAVITTILYQKLLNQYQKINEAQKKELENEKFIAISREHFKSLEKNIHETRRLKHDFKHELILINELAKEGNTEKIISFVKKEYDALSNYSIVQYSENYRLNIILSHYTKLAESSGIKCNVLCDFPDTTDICNDDLLVMIGNLYLNAIEACDRMISNDKKIDLLIKKEGNLILILLKNTFNSDTIKQSGDNFLSSKKSGNCGNGLASISLTANQLGGKATFKIVKDLFISTIYIYF